MNVGVRGVARGEERRGGRGGREGDEKESCERGRGVNEERGEEERAAGEKDMGDGHGSRLR